MTATEQNILRAWEENQKAGWALAEAVVALRDADTREARGNALDAVDRARRLQNASNSLLQPAQDSLAKSLNTSSKP